MVSGQAAYEFTEASALMAHMETLLPEARA